jgi:hypothetical protein
MIGEMNILEVSDNDLLNVILECNTPKEKNAFILHRLHQKDTGENKGENPIDPEEYFVNSTRVAARLLVKRNYFHKDGELEQFKKEKAKKEPVKKTVKKPVKKVAK